MRAAKGRLASAALAAALALAIMAMPAGAAAAEDGMGPPFDADAGEAPDAGASDAPKDPPDENTRRDGTGGADPAGTIPAKTPVREIAVADCKTEIGIGETVDLSVALFPSDADDQIVSYQSGDTRVATVSFTGQVKGVSVGAANIYIRAGGLTKVLRFKVAEPTESISVDSECVVLSPGGKHRIKASAMPGSAPQRLTYRSTDKRVAKVSKKGLVTALRTGSASILVSNGELTAGVTVIVDRGSAPQGAGRPGGLVDAAPKAEEKALPPLQPTGGALAFPASELPVLTKQFLAEMYRSSSVVEIDGPGYSITLRGRDIVNTENELSTEIAFAEKMGGFAFVLNGGRGLPGKVRLKLADPSVDRERLYLYNETKGRYEKLDSKRGGTITADTGGRYLLTDKDPYPAKVEPWAAGAAALALATAATAFVAARRRHWFW